MITAMFDVKIYENSAVSEHSKGRSEVIPNQALSIREIMERSARGHILAEIQGNALQYGDDEDEDGQDLFDAHDDKMDFRDKIGYLESRIRQAAELKAQNVKDEAEKAQASEAPKADSPKVEPKDE